MSPRATAVLLAAALALGGFVFFYELRAERGHGVADPQVRRVLLAAPRDADLVESLSFTTEEGTRARIERREDGWWVVEPIDAPADQAEVEGMVRRWKAARRGPASARE